MSALPERLIVPPRFSVKVTCEGRPHWIELRNGIVSAADHRDEQFSSPPQCLQVIADLETEGDLLAERETESLRERIDHPEPSMAGPNPVRATTRTIPGQLTRFMLLRSIARDAEIRPDPERFFVSRTRFIADQIFGGDAPWALGGVIREGRVLVTDDWLATVFVPGLEVVNGLPISAVRAEEGTISLLSLIAEPDGTIHSHELDWLDADLPPGLVLL